MIQVSKNRLSYLQSLKQRKFRQKYNIFTVEGDKMIYEVFKSPFINPVAIYALESWYDTHTVPVNITKYILKENEISKCTSFSHHQNVIIEAQNGLPADFVVEGNEIAIYLDNIQDPGNIGTILRVADWFGIRYVFFSEDTVEWSNPKLLQSSMGSAFRVLTRYCGLNDSFAFFEKQVICLGTDSSGTDLFEYDREPDQPLLLVLGNEGKGIKPENKLYIDEWVGITGGYTLGAESLNVSVAAGIMCAAFRQR